MYAAGVRGLTALTIAVLIPSVLTVTLDFKGIAKGHPDEIVTPQLLAKKTIDNITELTYMIVLDKKQYILHLKQNRILVSPDFKVFSYSKNDTLYSYQPSVPNDCYFQGYIQDHPYSTVALSTCSGLRGTMNLNGIKYAIEPDGPLTDFKHIIYRTDTSRSAMKCALDTDNSPSETESQPNMGEASARNKSAYVELFMVTTRPQFQFHKNEASLIESIFELMNTVSAILKPLNTQVVLVGIEIWSNGNLINTETDDADDILMEFLEWKRDSLDSRINCDVAALSLRESTVLASGLARLDGACSHNKAGFFAVMNLEKLVLSSNLFVHELGHVLGMKHDTPGCTCRFGKTICTMNETVLLSSGFSDCSIKDMEEFYASDKAKCLWNNPGPDKSLSYVPDCGSEEECSTNICCNSTTCKLTENATCSSGPCCENCVFLPRGTPCRTPGTECDLTEYCNGKSRDCPLDTYLQNGSPCNKGRSVCYQKMCYDYNEHCQSIFGEGAVVAPLSCFHSVNTVGDRFGNCGTDGELIQCKTQDVMCGRIQCQGVETIQAQDKYAAVIQMPNENSFCWGLDFRFRKDSIDHGAVPDGAVCGTGKICMNRSCVDLSVLGYDCDVEKKCGGNGVCNNNGNCHCDVKWAPPNCTVSGFGGSADSGPATENSFRKLGSTKTRQLENGAYSTFQHGEGMEFVSSSGYYICCLDTLFVTKVYMRSSVLH
ncbi:disintegrin and metalloproteinase domain-containing protein 9-like [Spea bombifrons]|uniref:disintegrin and metalloproteinase domain-containing protein 9-like n=1 Tax=Spea bombifrons TaxID=233779 RepID=UPI00234914EC|nr:disintegrin and metalloproteinase domain-containing protein 9-like [Spea bombifrons]